MVAANYTVNNLVVENALPLPMCLSCLTLNKIFPSQKIKTFLQVKHLFRKENKIVKPPSFEVGWGATHFLDVIQNFHLVIFTLLGQVNELSICHETK